MDNKILGDEKDIIFYNDEEGNTQVEVILQDDLESRKKQFLK